MEVPFELPVTVQGEPKTGVITYNSETDKVIFSIGEHIVFVAKAEDFTEAMTFLKK